MTEMAPAVALLFDDADLGAQLRGALCDRGARIVHEGSVASFTQQRLQEVAPDVLVINLDDAAEDALNQLYDLLDGDRPRVVFNDAQASRALAGWDRDRWARHLAAKVLQAGDGDPPRPIDAHEVEVSSAVETVATAETETAAVVSAQVEPSEVETPSALLPDPALADAMLEHVQRANSESESLAAELEALLAATELPEADTDENVTDTSPSFATDIWLDDGDGNGEPDQVTPASPAPAVGLDDFLLGIAPTLELSAEDVVSSSAAESRAAVAVSAPTDWALLDDEAPATWPGDHDAPGTFGIEKLSAADYLAPDVEKVAGSFEPIMSLELVSMEEAIAPHALHVDAEMHLDELHMALSRLVLTGAAADGIAAAVAFYAAVPATSRLTFLHTQHLEGRDAAALVGQLATVCPLTVRMAMAGSLTQPGEVLVVPPAQRVRVHRDGRVALQTSVGGEREPSIDDSFTAAAEGFGRDALGIVFSGHGLDAVAGAQAIRDRGGSIWVESASA
ncbi:MAG: chemotaxis protein CheB, partial [Rhodanobacter sp.]